MIGIWNWSSRSLSSTTLNPDSLEQQQQSILNKEVSIPRVYCKDDKDVFVTIDVDDVLGRFSSQSQTDVFFITFPPPQRSIFKPTVKYLS